MVPRAPQALVVEPSASPRLAVQAWLASSLRGDLEPSESHGRHS